MEMEKELTIQQVAEWAGITPNTLRYYERVGLLDHIERAASGHRRYTSTDLDWIEFLLYLRSTGMTIRQMQVCAELRRGGDATCRERLAFLQTHRERVKAQMRKLESHLDFVEKKITYLQTKVAAEDEQLAAVR